MSWSLAGGVAALVLHLLYRRRNSRSLLTAGFLVAAVVLLGFSLFEAGTRYPRALGVALVVALGLGSLLVVVLAVLLVASGIVTVRREGFGLSTSLSLALGLLLLVAPLVTLLVAGLRTGVAYAVALALTFAMAYAGLTFAVFLTFAFAQGRRTVPERAPGTIVVLGSRVIDGRVPPLLASRLDRALDLYRSTRAQTGAAPLLITSGGQGSDEVRSESDAMSEYLLARGADPADVRGEDRSTSTRENLRFSREVQQRAGRGGPVVVVTNNFHVLRAALHARRLGIDADVVGSPTARYYTPNAVVREFVATVVDQRRMHLALLTLPCLALTTGLVLAVRAA